MRSLLLPGLRLMAGLRLPAKLGLMFGVLLLPLALLLAEQAADTLRGLAASARQLQGAQATQALLQLHAAHALPADAAALASAVQAVDQALAGAAAALLPQWPAQRGQLARPEAAAWATAAAPGTALPGRPATQRVQELLLVVGHRAGLLLGAEPQGQLLAALVVEQLAPLRTALAGATSPEPGVRAVAAGRMDERLFEAGERMDALARAGLPAPQSWVQLVTAAQQLRALATEPMHDPAANRARAQVAAQAQAAVQAVGEDLLAQMRRHCDDDARGLWRRAAAHGALALAGLLAAAYLTWAFYAGFSGSLQAVIQGMDAMAAGDMSRSFRIHGKDELALVTQRLELMAAHLSALVAEIRSSAVRVDQAGGRVAEDGLALATRNEEQAGCVQRTVGSLNTLATALQHNAQSAQAVQGLADGLAAKADEGASAVDCAAGSVRGLEASVRKVAEINALIDDLAFQTNLLALNASVEAAHAGDAGKGFAVVAADVRQLAGRCAEAASQVRTLVDQGLEQVGHSAAIIDDAQATLRGIATGVGQLGQRLAGLAAQGGQQTRLLDEASQGVGGLQDITRRNADMVQHTGGASRALADQARALRRSVASTRLRQGSADEARAMVERAMAHVAEVGWAQAAQTFKQAHGAFVDRDMFVFAVDAQGRYQAAGPRQDLLGRSVYEVAGLPGERVDRYLAACRQAAARGGGWAEYEWLRPDGEGGLVWKTAWVVPLDGGYLGCSVFRSGPGAAELAHRSAQAAVAVAVAA